MASYYMRADGSATKANAVGPGTDSTKCMSVATHNAATFSLDDIIKLCDNGGEFTSTIITPSSGTAGHPIIYEADTGGSPIINGADTGLFSAQGTANVWQISGITAEPKVAFFDGVLGTRVAVLPAAPLEWGWAANILYVYYVGQPQNHVYAGQRYSGINLGAKSNVTVQGNITVKNHNGHGIWRTGAAGSNIAIDGVTSTYNYYSGIALAYIVGVTVKNSIATYNGGSGIALNTVVSSIIEDNTTQYNKNAGMYDPTDDEHLYSGGIRLVGLLSEDNIIQNNISTNNVGVGIWIDYTGIGNIIRYNLVGSNGSHGIWNEVSSSNQCYYNLVYSNNYGITITGSGLEDRYPSNSNLVYNNTIYGNTLAGLYMYNEDVVQGYTNSNVIKNNIITGTSGGPELKVINNVDAESNTFANNCLGAEKANFVEWGTGHLEATYDGWEVHYGGTTTSIESDPLLNDPPTNFHILSTSPCIKTGVGVGLLRDYEGKAVIGIPDVGAYECVTKLLLLMGIGG